MPAPSCPYIAKALFDYTPTEPTELLLRVGDVVTVLEQNKVGWVYAHSKSATTNPSKGWIPQDFVVAEDNRDDDQLLARLFSQSVPSVIDNTTTVTANKIAAAPYKLPQVKPTDLPALPMPVASSASPATSTVALKECAVCHDKINGAFVMANGVFYHPQHFTCTQCKCTLAGRPYLTHDQIVYCETDYYKLFNPKCSDCNETIEGPYVSALNQHYHTHHFTCATCHQPFQNGQFRAHNGRAYCEQHFAEQFAPKCYVCQRAITSNVFEALDHQYHLECFTCSVDQHPLAETDMFHLHNGKVYCSSHYETMFLPTCTACTHVIKGQYIEIGKSHFHAECWTCNKCKAILNTETVIQVNNGLFECRSCQNVSTTTVSQVKSAKEISSLIISKNSALTNNPFLNELSTANSAQTESRSLRSVPSSASSSTTATTIVGTSMTAYVDPSSSPSVPYAQLRDKLQRPSTVDPARTEAYLSNDEFNTVFGMNHDKFNALAKWKRDEQKKKVGLF